MLHEVLAADWPLDYNSEIPHGSLGGLTPGSLPRAVDLRHRYRSGQRCRVGK